MTSVTNTNNPSRGEKKLTSLVKTEPKKIIQIQLFYMIEPLQDYMEREGIKYLDDLLHKKEFCFLYKNCYTSDRAAFFTIQGTAENCLKIYEMLKPIRSAWITIQNIFEEPKRLLTEEHYYPTLQDLYKAAQCEPTPRQEFISKMMHVTGKSYDTILSWVQGKRNPSKGEIETIKRHFVDSYSKGFFEDEKVE